MGNLHLMGGTSTTERLASRGLLGIVDAMASAYAVTREDILGARRTKQAAAARHAVMRALRDMGMSYPEIGWLLGRDHTTVLAALRKAPANAVRVA
jgi:chromosomal replication initiation ATPase DnaA